MKGIFEEDPEQWVVPEAILPEVDHLVAEHLGAKAIATLDLRHFGAVSIKGNPRLLPRDT